MKNKNIGKNGTKRKNNTRNIRWNMDAHAFETFTYKLFIPKKKIDDYVLRETHVFMNGNAIQLSAKLLFQVHTTAGAGSVSRFLF